MMIDAGFIMTAAKVVTALGVLIGVVLKIHSFTLEQKKLREDLTTQKQELEDKISERESHYEERISKLEKHHDSDMHRINEETCLLCYAMAACLDGLQQLGATHNDVPEAKEKLDKYLNRQAHK